jgi:hypothetical protein
MSLENAENGPKSRHDRVPGVILLGAMYTLKEAKLRLGWTESALRAAKRRGLRILRCGKRGYVSGSELQRFLESQ